MKMSPQDLQPGDYPEYYHPYIAYLPQNDLLSILKDQMDEMCSFLRNLKSSDLKISYAPGKWTVSQVIQHMIDTERIFQYRALRIARNDITPLAGYDQDAYAPVSGAENRTAESYLNEYVAVRRSGICLFETFNDEMYRRKGFSNDKHLSAAAAGFIIAGHEKHHFVLFKSHYKL